MQMVHTAWSSITDVDTSCAQLKPRADAEDFGLLLTETGSSKDQQASFYGATAAVQQRWVSKAPQWWQRLAAAVVCFFVTVRVVSKFCLPKHASATNCMALTYPQCQGAIEWYISQGASSRCQAFEHVKAEGDFFKFPDSLDKKDRCNVQGCCDCPGQCSKCPPILPECLSWRLDGQWKVAFSDGAEATYSFDATGHMEMKLPAGELPRMFHLAPGTQAIGGTDLWNSAQWLTSQEAQELCERTAGCQVASWDSAHVKTSTGCWKLGSRQTGSEMPGQTMTIGNDPRACNDRCLKVQGCKRWSLLNRKTCYLFASKVRAEIPDGNSISGSPDCLDDCTCPATNLIQSGECKQIAADLGASHNTAESCLSAALEIPACADEIMWSPAYFKQWGCRCCANNTGFNVNGNWQIRSCESVVCKSPVAGKSGLEGSAEHYLVSLKSKPTLLPTSGSHWQSLVEQPRVAFPAGVAVAGPLMTAEVMSTSFGTSGHEFVFDLHQAAPDIFPNGAREILNLVGGELRVRRGSLKGIGIRVK